MPSPTNITSSVSPKTFSWEQVLGLTLWFILFAAIAARSIHDFSHSYGYTGRVSEMKGEKSGVIIDLDGKYPDQKMTIWVLRKVAIDLDGRWPKIGSNLTVSGKITQYRGRPEIIINNASQMAEEMSGIIDTSR